MSMSPARRSDGHRSGSQHQNNFRVQRYGHRLQGSGTGHRDVGLGMTVQNDLRAVLAHGDGQLPRCSWSGVGIGKCVREPFDREIPIVFSFAAVNIGEADTE